MKKLFLLLFALGMATMAFPQINTRQVVGKWKYTVDTGSELITGVFKFVEKEGKLVGEIVTGDGTTIPFSKVDLMDENKLNLEAKTDYEVYKISVIITGDKFSGTGSSSQVEAPITGEKITEP